uniref:Radical SAM-associated putative lipoprotein n=1 Tax=Prevotella sp. GTC17262 TaxID=3236797 RepID=A0AB33JIS7_9BACT
MKIKLNRWYYALLASLLAMLGFESCDFTGADEYGTPIVSYQVKGNVKGDAGALKGIRVIAKTRNPYDVQRRDTVYTDANGHFSTKKLQGFGSSVLKEELVIVYEDVDGEANGGTFEKDSLKGAEVTITQKEKGAGWYEGHFEVTADKKLNKKIK